VDSPDLTKIRRFALIIALILLTLVLAGVKLDTPLHVEPLGIPLVVQRPDLLSVALVIAAIYSTIRYVYYGMMLQPSPMRARRELMAGKVYTTNAGGLEEYDKSRTDFQQKVDRWFPQLGKHKVTFNSTFGGGAAEMTSVKVPTAVRLLCWIENLDFVLPILANIVGVGLWTVRH